MSDIEGEKKLKFLSKIKRRSKVIRQEFDSFQTLDALL